MKKQSSKQLATKKDIQVLRSEFKSTKKSLFGQMLKLEEKVENVDEKLEKTKDELLEHMKKQHNEVMTAVSNFAGRVETLEDENTLGTDRYSELDKKATDHEKRITRLESPTAA